MVKNKSEALLDLIIGILFLVVGALLLSMRNDMLLVTIVVIADLLLGAVLLISGVAGLIKRSPASGESDDEQVQEWDDTANDEQTETAVIPVAAEEKFWDEPEQIEEQPAADNSVEALTAREAELRKIVKQRRMEARQATDASEQASAAAAAAEQALVDAENAMKYVSDAEKSAYLTKIDRLADDAMERSQQAVFAARKAKVAERALAEAISEHRQAMDAAAEAMMAAEDAEWNNR